MVPTLRAAGPDDVPFLLALEENAMRGYAEALWGAWRQRPIEPERIGCHRIVVEGGRDVGCVETLRRDDHIWINKLYLLAGYRGRGIGASILRGVIAEAHAQGLPVRLSVLTTNPAIAFYRREGLVVYDETPERRFMTTQMGGRKPEILEQRMP